MKKFIIGIIAICMAVACCEIVPSNISVSHNDEKLHDDYVEVMTITIDGVSHEYLQWCSRTDLSDCRVGGLCHYPECKYCKEKHQTIEEAVDTTDFWNW